MTRRRGRARDPSGIAVGDRICRSYSSDEEHRDVLASSIADGLTAASPSEGKLDSFQAERLEGVLLDAIGSTRPPSIDLSSLHFVDIAWTRMIVQLMGPTTHYRRGTHDACR